MPACPSNPCAIEFLHVVGPEWLKRCQPTCHCFADLSLTESAPNGQKDWDPTVHGGYDALWFKIAMEVCEPEDSQLFLEVWAGNSLVELAHKEVLAQDATVWHRW